MPLAAGRRLGPYEILTLLGAGGMGEVYKARDTRLDRTVAIKILSTHVITDSQFRTRFDREARAIAALNHPHICTLHDVGHQEGIDFLVMEYLDGQTVADRLAKGAIALDQALTTAIEIADALDKAHRQGIVHRDLKPGNVMLTKSGAKLLDFGLAKLHAAGQPVVQSIPITKSTGLTAQGSILGTLHYMSPEQLEGKEADARSDLFAFGAVVYEMVTGRKAFEGKSHASVIAAILDRDPPPMSVLQPLTPRQLDHVVSRCLAKDPDERWQSSRDLLFELEWLSATQLTSRSDPLNRQSGWRRRIVFTAAAAAMGVLLAMLATWTLVHPRASASPRPARFVVNSIGWREPFAPPVPLIAISPDGARIVYAMFVDDKSQLYVRTIDQVESTAIPGTEGGYMPFFSPDSAWLAFFAAGKLKKVRLGVSAPTTICDAAEPRGGSWGPDGTIVFASAAFTGLSRVSSDGGKPESLTTLDNSMREVSHRWPSFLPDGSGVLFAIGYDGRTSFDQANIALYTFTTGRRRVVLQGGSFPRVLRDGYLLFTRGHSLLAAPFDLTQHVVHGRAVTVENNVTTVNGWGSAQVEISDEGTLAYVPAVPAANRRLLWVDRAGHEEPLPLQPRVFSRPRVSPDGRRFLVIVRDAVPAIWIYDAPRGVFSPNASLKGDTWFEPLWSPSAVWSPDARTIAYTTDEGAKWKLWRKPADGSAPEEMLLADDVQFAPTAWSPDSRTLAMDEVTIRTRVDVALLPLSKPFTIRRVLQTEISEENARFSPDGRWLAYDAGLQTTEVYVRAFPGPGPTIQVSIDGGRTPVWAANGRELFYWTAAGIMAAPVSRTGEISTGVPRLLIPGDFREEYDVSPDGHRFLLMKQDGAAPPIQLHVVTGWLDHVRQSVGATPSK